MTLMKHFKRTLCWFRRDLRLTDHAALHHALRHSEAVVCVFIFDTTLLAPLPHNDRRVDFIWQSLFELKTRLESHGSTLIVRHDDPLSAIPALAQQYQAEAVFCNRDYEPMAILRDAAVANRLQDQGCRFFDSKDHVIFERDEVLTQQGRPFSVFTPYKNAWRKRLAAEPLPDYPTEPYFSTLAPLPAEPLPSLAALGFQDTHLDKIPVHAGVRGGEILAHDFYQRIQHYKTLRDFPARKGVSYLSVHLRFGTVSIRELVRHALTQDFNEGAESWLNELIWRDFYQQILWHRPDLAQGHSFKPEYQSLEWPGEDAHFKAWCNGQTGYPLVDAAMRQLLHCGWMHNRLRMIVASFLTKDLLIDWRRGEAWFAQHLLDFDFAANNGGWQWAASTGCDAQPYFRIFNPVSQSEKFDPNGEFIRRYVPELSHFTRQDIHAPWLAKQPPAAFKWGQDYPRPIVDHAVQRQKALALFSRD